MTIEQKSGTGKEPLKEDEDDEESAQGWEGRLHEDAAPGAVEEEENEKHDQAAKQKQSEKQAGRLHAPRAPGKGAHGESGEDEQRQNGVCTEAAADEDGRDERVQEEVEQHDGGERDDGKEMQFVDGVCGAVCSNRRAKP